MDNTDETSSKRMALLIELHQQLDNEADNLSSKRYLLPSERMRLRVLKVNRLKAKDAIRRLKREENEKSNH